MIGSTKALKVDLQIRLWHWPLVLSVNMANSGHCDYIDIDDSFDYYSKKQNAQSVSIIDDDHYLCYSLVAYIHRSYRAYHIK